MIFCWVERRGSTPWTCRLPGRMSSAAGSATGPTSGLATSVADPDPYVFGPPGSGSGSVLDFLSLKNDVNVPYL